MENDHIFSSVQTHEGGERWPKHSLNGGIVSSFGLLLSNCQSTATHTHAYVVSRGTDTVSLQRRANLVRLNEIRGSIKDAVLYHIYSGTRWLQCEKSDPKNGEYILILINVQPTVKFTANHTHVVSRGTDTQCPRKGERILSA